MNLKELLALEERVLELRRDLEAERGIYHAPPAMRDYYGTLWLNLGALARSADALRNEIACKYEFESEVG